MNLSQKTWLYLFSSNAQEKYLIDALAALMIPRGAVVHVRYEEQYVNPALWAHIAESSRADTNPHRDQRVLFSYLYQELQLQQEQAGRSWNPIQIYPFRAGSILDIYREGGIAHVFFIAEEYPDYAAALSLLTQIPGASLGLGINTQRKNYAGLNDPFPENLLSTESDSQAFRMIVRSLNEAHLRTYRVSGDGLLATISYDPVFFQILPPKAIKYNFWAESFRESIPLPESLYEKTNERAYFLKRGESYLMRFALYQPEWSSVPSQGHVIVVSTEEGRFSTPAVTRLAVSSRYDLHEIYLAPDLKESGHVTPIRIYLESPKTANARETQQSRRIVAPETSLYLRIPPRFSRNAAAALDLLGIVAGAAIGAIGVLIKDVAESVSGWVLILALLAASSVLVYRRSLLGR